MIKDRLEIRESAQDDWRAIESLYPEAFPDEDLLPLVCELLRDATVTTSLVGVENLRIVAHAIFTKCGVVGTNIGASLLGPLAVAPAWQRQGIGRAVVSAGCRRLQSTGVSIVFVLGDPAYYQRLGFAPESQVEPPYDLPVEWAGAWQSKRISELSAPCAGKLSVPRQWLKPALWAP